MERKYDLYAKLIMTFGKEAQIIVAIEELAELQKELTKWLRDKGHICNIAEEIADVQIMLEQLKFIFACNNEVNEIIQKKLERTEALIELSQNSKNCEVKNE